MVQKMLMIALLCILAGCEITSGPVSAPTVAKQEVVTVPVPPPQPPEAMPAVEAPEPPQAPGAMPVVATPEPPQAVPVMEQLEPSYTEEMDAASLQARAAMEQSISRGITQADDNLTRDAETIIAENRWGFSVYDPATNIVEYYAANGVLLGKREA